MQARKNQSTLARLSEKEYFNNVGKNASDKYYLNQDKKDAAMAKLKSTSKQVAEDLRQQQVEAQKERALKMQADADKRQCQLDALKTEEQKRKDEIKSRKDKLKQVQADDARAKQGHRERQSQLANRVEDFSERNLLSYVYSTKEH